MKLHKLFNNVLFKIYHQYGHGRFLPIPIEGSTIFLFVWHFQKLGMLERKFCWSKRLADDSIITFLRSIVCSWLLLVYGITNHSCQYLRCVRGRHLLNSLFVLSGTTSFGCQHSQGRPNSSGDGTLRGALDENPSATINGSRRHLSERRRPPSVVTCGLLHFLKLRPQPPQNSLALGAHELRESDEASSIRVYKSPTHERTSQGIVTRVRVGSFMLTVL